MKTVTKIIWNDHAIVDLDLTNHIAEIFKTKSENWTIKNLIHTIPDSIVVTNVSRKNHRKRKLKSEVIYRKMKSKVLFICLGKR